MSTGPNYTAISMELLEQGISFSGLCEGGCMRFDNAPVANSSHADRVLSEFRNTSSHI
jgi:hypothetical protein